MMSERWEGLLGVPVAFGKCCRGGAPHDGGCEKPCGCNVGCQRSGRIDYEGGQAGPPYLVVSCPGWGCGGYVNAPPGFPPAEDSWREFQERCPQARGCPMPCAAAPPAPPPPPKPPPESPQPSPPPSQGERVPCPSPVDPCCYEAALGAWNRIRSLSPQQRAALARIDCLSIRNLIAAACGAANVGLCACELVTEAAEAIAGNRVLGGGTSGQSFACLFCSGEQTKYCLELGGYCRGNRAIVLNCIYTLLSGILSGRWGIPFPPNPPVG
jgi:hypothetical protein